MTSATTCSGSTPTGQQLSYDAEGRLTSWQNTSTSPTSTANYLYDGSGNRVAALTTVNGTQTLTAYIGGIEEVQKSGSTISTTTYYSVAGQRVAANVNGTFYYFGYDALGSKVAVFNSSGNLIGSQLYGPYGNQRYANGSLPTSIGFTGQQADSTTGLDYYGARYYDPTTGQFLAADVKQGNTEGDDPYTYAVGNPETLTDPTGQMVTHAVGGLEGVVPDAFYDAWNGEPTNNLDPTVGSSDTVTSGDTTYSYDPGNGDITVTTPSGGTTYWPDGDGYPGDPGYNTILAKYNALLSAQDAPQTPVNSGMLNRMRQQQAAQDAGNAASAAQPQTGGGGSFGGGGGGPKKPVAAGPPAPDGPGRMDPQDIYFSQDYCSSGGPGYTIAGNVKAIQNGSLTADDMPPVRVFQKDASMDDWGPMTRGKYSGNPANLENGRWYTLDNRRLLTFIRAGVTNIPVVNVTGDSSQIQGESYKFSTTDGGDTIVCG